jgi:heat shock protein HslJ
MKALRPAALLVSGAVLAVGVTAADAQGRRGRTIEQQQQQQPPAQGQGLTQKQEKQFPLGASWTAVTLNGKPFSGERPTMAVSQQLRATGFGGCNNFSATLYPLRQQAIAVGPVARTRKSCDKGVEARELEFLTALRTAAQWDLVGPQLVIKGQNGELRFERSI